MLIPRRQKMIIETPLAKQRGVVLMIALIVLIGMTLAGLALMRSMDTSNIIAGNLAFQQAATQAGDAGTEAAINWLETNNNGATLQTNSVGSGYYATFQNSPTGNQTWDSYWSTLVATGVFPLPTDVLTGNTAAYVIQRLCNATGDPRNANSGCSTAAGSGVSNSDINSNDSGAITLLTGAQVYYRITTRVQGPRNTVSYVQTIVAL